MACPARTCRLIPVLPATGDSFVKRNLLSLLACPVCHSRFETREQSADETGLIEGMLVCSGCRREFPIARGIPRFIYGELGAEKEATAQAFGYEWTHYSTLTGADKAEFLSWIAPVTEDDFVDRVVLDAGCGKGRHITLASQFGAREVVGIDLSNAVEAAYQNTRHLPNVHVIQADIFNLPFDAPFDLAYSIGVLHHLPNPKEGFLAMAEHTKPEGRISIWVYGKEGNQWIEKIVNPLRIHFTSRLPKSLTRLLTFFIALPLYLALKFVYRPVELSTRMAWLKSRLFYSEYLCAISGYSFAENFWNVFDHLVAPTAFYHSRDEVEDWFATANAERVEITQRNNNSWRGTGLIPADAPN